ncbi:MAG: GEVED domain-containing protein, partial [Lentimicrobiaceae bacterium]
MKNTTKWRQHKWLLMLLCFFMTLGVSAQQVLLTESFENGGSIPAGWSNEIVAGNDALSFVQTTTSPSGFTAFDGAYMVKFNSYSYSTAVNRLRTTNSFSTVGLQNITVEFAWLESTSYPSNMDNVIVQWSNNGTTWNDVDTYVRPGVADAWVVKTDLLPLEAKNQPKLYLAFQFTSAWGNNCYLDDVTVTADPLTSPVTMNIGTGTITKSYPYYTFYEDARTQIIYTAAEITAAGGVPGKITALGFNVSSRDAEPMYGFSIDMQNYAGSTISAAVTSGWTNVYSGTYTIPSTGWHMINFTTPFIWDGTSNLLINVCFDNDDYSSSSSVYSSVAPDLTWHRHTDGVEGCGITGSNAAVERPNIQMILEPDFALPKGIMQGFVTNAYGVPLPDATIYAEGEFHNYTTTSGPNGAYLLSDIDVGTYKLTAGKAGYNIVTIEDVIVFEGQITNQNIALTQPSIAVTPNPYNVTLNPNEYLDGAFEITNNGTGPLMWNAEIVFPEKATSNIYPDYLSVRGDLPAVDEPVSAGVAPHPALYASDNNMQLRDPGDIAYCYVASPGSGSLDAGPGSFLLNAPGTITRFGNAITGTDAFVMAADWANGIWYGVNYAGNAFVTIDPVTGAYTAIGTTGGFSGISYNEQNDKMYGLTFEGSLQTINLLTGATTNVGSAGTDGFIDFTIDNDGMGYAVNIVTDEFGTINLETGAWASIAPLGFNANYAQGMSCDHSTNEIYYAAYDASAGGKLLLMNKETGASSLIGAFPGGAEIDGFAIPGNPSGAWLTLGQYAGVVNASSNFALPVYFSAEGTEAGQVYTADVVFTSTPDVGTRTIPVTMVIAGPALDFPEDLTAVLSNPITGQVNLSWTFTPTEAFVNFVIKRDQAIIGYSTTNTFTNILPAFGTYNYTVQAVYEEGSSLPAGPVEVEWPNPTMEVDPLYIYDEVWVDNQVVQTIKISNTGEGTLAFSFPEWVPEDGSTHAPLAYCSASGGCDEYISRLQFATIDNASSCGGYSDFTSVSTDVEMGETYPLTITNPSSYSADIAGVWIDWNQNELFTDAGEFLALTSNGGGASFTGNILIPENALPGPTRMRARVQFSGTLSPCGTTSYGDVEDYTLNVTLPTFIVNVNPASGTIPAGGSKTVSITWDATGFDPGASYMEDLVVESNDLNHPSITISNEMFVYVPAQLAGTVTDITTGEPLSGVTVTAAPAGEFSTYTLDDDTYEGGYGYGAGNTGGIGNLFENTDEGYLTSVDAYFYGGNSMTMPLTIKVFDATQTLIGTSAPVTITDAGWYTFNFDNIPYSGDFYAVA